MKKLFRLMLAFCLLCGSALGVDSLTATASGGQFATITYSWTSDGSGDAVGATSEVIPGILYSCTTVPDTVAVPTDDYDVIVRQQYPAVTGSDVVVSTDVAGSLVINRDSVNTESVQFFPDPGGSGTLRQTNGKIRIVVSNAGAATKGKCILTIYRGLGIKTTGVGLVPPGGASSYILQYDSPGAAKWIQVSGQGSLADGGALSLSGIDISDDTNLSAGSGIVLTGDALSHDTATGYKHVPTAGATTQVLQWSADGTAKWVTVSSDGSIADGGAFTVADDSHAHTGSTLSSIDVSADTNLAVTAPIVLTDDTLSHSTTAGSVHVPTGGATNQPLIYGGASGTAAWSDNLALPGTLSATTGTFTGTVSGNNTTTAFDSTDSSVGLFPTPTTVTEFAAMTTGTFGNASGMTQWKGRMAIGPTAPVGANLYITHTPSSAKSVSSISNSSGTATVNCTGHGFVVGQWVNIAGCTGETGYNAGWEIKTVPGVDSFTISVLNTWANPGGTITATSTASMRLEDVGSSAPMFWLPNFSCSGLNPGTTINTNMSFNRTAGHYGVGIIGNDVRDSFYVATNSTGGVPGITDPLRTILLVANCNNRVGILNSDPGKVLDVTGDGQFTTNLTVGGDLAVNGGDLTSTASSFNFLNANITTFSGLGACTTYGIGAGAAATGTFSFTTKIWLNSGSIDSNQSTVGFMRTPDSVGVGKDSTAAFTMTSRFLPRQVNDAGPMTATAGSTGEFVYNLANSKWYGCTVGGSPATWSAFN